MELLVCIRSRGLLLLPVLTLSFLGIISSPPPTAPPLFDGYPFVVIWNMPTPVCKVHNVKLDTSPFKAVTTPSSVPDQFLILFYKGRLGLYPYVDKSTGQQFNGGIPQKGNLTESLNVAFMNIEYYIPSETAAGLAVIDWEAWRPLWDRNWDSKEIYQKLSVDYARELDANLTAKQAATVAKEQFEKAARSYMEDTLELGIVERPRYLWGFYLFPDCYNYGWDAPGYTGECSAAVKSQNDELLWLWETSTALYPSVYLDSRLGDSRNAALFARNQVQEAVRVAALPRQPFAAPVYVYSRPVFANLDGEFLSSEDLVSTIGESAALGASGSVLWGASADFDDQESCLALSAYLASTLNPYVANVTAAAKLCSAYLCQGNGRCVRKDYNSDSYLHLNPSSFAIRESDGKYLAVGVPSASDLAAFAESFTCQCYAGKSCSPRLPAQLPVTWVSIPV